MVVKASIGNAFNAILLQIRIDNSVCFLVGNSIFDLLGVILIHKEVKRRRFLEIFFLKCSFFVTNLLLHVVLALPSRDLLNLLLRKLALFLNHYIFNLFDFRFHNLQRNRLDDVNFKVVNHWVSIEFSVLVFVQTLEVGVVLLHTIFSNLLHW